MTASSLRRSILASIALPLASCGGTGAPPLGTTSTANAGGQGGAGGVASSAGGAAAAGTSAGGAGFLACASPVPVVVQGVDTGYVACAQGSIHRPSAKACPSALPRAAGCVTNDAAADACKTDADCTMFPYGACSTSDENGPPGCSCGYGCVADADCGANEVCLCGDPVGSCVEASGCTTDADCGGGALCLSYESCGPTFACQSAADTCVGDNDCTLLNSGQQCIVAPVGEDGARHCQSGCVVGRPLVMERALRLARLKARADWASPARLA